MTMPGANYGLGVCALCQAPREARPDCPWCNPAPKDTCNWCGKPERGWDQCQCRAQVTPKPDYRLPHETRRLLPSDAAERKKYPMCAGLVDYFPDALAAVANVSWRGNEQHNPGEPVHWARGKSTDQSDTLMRHLVQRGTLDVDGMRHSAKMAWRALALLQEELEKELGLSMPRGAR